MCEAKASQPTLSALPFILVNEYPTCVSLDAVTQRWEVHCRFKVCWRKAYSRPVVYGQRLASLRCQRGKVNDMLRTLRDGRLAACTAASVSLIHLGLCVDKTSTVDGRR